MEGKTVSASAIIDEIDIDDHSDGLLFEGRIVQIANQNLATVTKEWNE